MNLIKNSIRILIFIFDLPVRFFSFLNRKLNNLKDSINQKSIEKTSTRFDEDGRYLEFSFLNTRALDAYEGLKIVYQYLINDVSYLSFGNNKVIKLNKIIKLLIK
jgi:hypothetical protein